MSASTEVLDIRLFGRLSIHGPRGGLPPIPTEKARSLFAYLAYHADQSHRREKLVGLFWPDLPEQTARRRLSQELWRIRHHLDEHFGHSLVLSGPEIRFDPQVPCTVDVHCFLEETAPDQDLEALARAVERYREDLLVDLDDEWILPLREHLRQRYLAALTTLAEAEGQAGRWERALEHALRLTRVDPLVESGHRLVMQAYVHLGQPHMALAQFQELERLLQEELGTAPTPATLQLAERIRIQMRTSSPAELAPFLETPEGLPLVGRDRERAQLVEAVEWAISGSGGVVLVEGEAGIGKSKLLDALAEDAAWRGAQIYRAAAAEVEEQAMAVLLRAVAPFLTPLHVQQLALVLDPLWLAVLSQIFPEIASTLDGLPQPPTLAPDAARRRAMEALLHLLRAIGRLGPAVLLLDDLHRADQETLELLRLLARELRSEPVLVVAAYRGEAIRAVPERWEALQAIDRAGVQRRLILRPLDRAAAGELVRLALGMGQTPAPFAARIHTKTGGNPFFVLESLRALYEDGLLHRTAQGEWSTPWDTDTSDQAEMVLPERVEELLAQRLRRLPWESQALLAPASVLGSEFTLPVLQAMVSLPPAQVLQALRQLVAQGILVETDTHLRFHHDLIREVIYQNMPMHRARTLHHRAGEVLAAQGEASSAVLAHHFTLAQDWPHALEHHRRAGREALDLSDYRRARYHFEQALEALEHLEEDDPEQRMELLLAQEQAVAVLGDLEAWAQVLERLVPLTAQDPARTCEVLCRTAAFHLHQSHYLEAREAAERALSLAQESGQVEIQVKALTLLGQVADHQGAAAQAVALLQQAVALETQDALPQAEALLALASALGGVKQYAQAREAASLALERFGGLGFRHRQVDALNVLGIVSMEEGLYQQAADYHRRGVELSQQIGYRYGEVRARVNLANVFSKIGELDRCIRTYEEVLALCPTLGMDRVEAIARVNLASNLVAFVGDTARARALLGWVLDYARQAGDRIALGHALSVLTAADLTDERWEAARCHMDRAKEILAAADEFFVLAQFCRARALWHVEQGDLDAAIRELDEGLALCRKHGMAALFPWILSMKGWIRAQQGAVEEALALAQEAMETLGQVDEMDYMMWYHQAVVLEAAGRTQEARQALAQAVERLEVTLAALSPEHRAMSRERVPEHRAILAAWARYRPERQIVTLPGRDGTAAHTVEWTVRAPEDADLPEGPPRRRHRLRRLLAEAAEQGARPTVQALAQALGVSPRTIRRDLRELETSGAAPGDGASPGEGDGSLSAS